MKTRNFTVLTIGLLTFSLTVRYNTGTKKFAVNASALIWEWVW